MVELPSIIILISVYVQLQCGLQVRQMQGHVVDGQQRIVENQHEQCRFLATLNEKLECVLEKLDQIAENRGNLDQLFHPFISCFDDPRVMSTDSLGSYPIDLPKPTNHVANTVFVKA